MALRRSALLTERPDFWPDRGEDPIGALVAVVVERVVGDVPLCQLEERGIGPLVRSSDDTVWTALEIGSGQFAIGCRGIECAIASFGDNPAVRSGEHAANGISATGPYLLICGA